MRLIPPSPQNNRPVRLRVVRTTSNSTYFIKANQLRFCIHERGHADNPVILMIGGLGWQMTIWPDALLNGLMEQGFRVICFDNRDIGLTDKIHSRRLFNTRLAFVKAQSKLHVEANYTLYDMATDTSELIKMLGLRRVHVVGMDMGGGIGQILAATQPHQVASLTLIGTSTNDPQLPLPDMRLLRLINQSAPPAHRQEAVVERWMEFWHMVRSPRYPVDTQALHQLLVHNFKRSYCPEGALRQLQAIIATGTLRRLIPRIQCPTLILHGEKDKLVHPLGGKDLQRHIKGSRLRVLIGMGHDLPPALCPQLIDHITENATYGTTE